MEVQKITYWKIGGGMMSLKDLESTIRARMEEKIEEIVRAGEAALAWRVVGRRVEVVGVGEGKISRIVYDLADMTFFYTVSYPNKSFTSTLRLDSLNLLD
jgi:hypothetical protein